MKQKNKSIIIVVIILLIAVIIGIKLKDNKNENGSENSESNKIDIYDKDLIEEVKKDINATGDSDIYQIEEEYDGRKILQIKPNIQFETVLSGILKNDIPTEDEISSLTQNKPVQSGIWISYQSREKFIEILQDNNINNYAINEDGYLYQTEENDTENSRIINDAIQSDRLYIIDISGTCYIRDNLSGEIVEYPFERMDPYQVLEVYTYEKSTILEITENIKQKLSNQEIIEVIISNILATKE